MDIQIRSINNITIFDLTGRFDAHTAPQIASWLEQTIHSSSPYIIINVAGVSFLDSIGLVTLVHALKQSQQHNGDLRLCNVPEPVRLILELTHLDGFFELFASETDAIQTIHQLNVEVT